MKGDFSPITKNILAKRANEKCTICNAQTSKPNTKDPNKFINLGEAAHIKGKNKAKNNRYDSNQTDEDRSHINNGIWLCTRCHKEIDSDSEKYSVQFLLEVKREHENKVSLGEFEINWKEYQALKKRILDLEQLHKLKNKNQTLEKSFYNKEIQEIRLELEKAKREKRQLEENIQRLKTTLATFNIQSPSSEEKEIVSAIKAGEFENAKNLLKDEVLLEDEEKAARKRLLKATINEIESDYVNAELNYSKAYQFSKKPLYSHNYIAFLKRVGKNDVAIKVCEETLLGDIDHETRIETTGLLGGIYSTLDDNLNAFIQFKKALDIIQKHQESNNNRYNLNKARLENVAGVAKKKMGMLDDALHFFETSLNTLWCGSLNDGNIHHSDLADLQNNIANLYLENNNPDLALHFIELAKENYNKANIPALHFAHLYINQANIFSHHKKRDFKSARKSINSALEIIEIEFANSPLTSLEYYIGALTKSGDIFISIGDTINAKFEYQKAINISEEYSKKLNITYKDTLISLYTNYGIYNFIVNNVNDGNYYINKAIKSLLSFSDSEHTKHRSLAEIYHLQSKYASNNLEKMKLLKKAHNHIKQCNNNKTLSRVTKILIEKDLKSLKKN